MVHVAGLSKKNRFSKKRGVRVTRIVAIGLFFGILLIEVMLTTKSIEKYPQTELSSARNGDIAEASSRLAGDQFVSSKSSLQELPRINTSSSLLPSLGAESRKVQNHDDQSDITASLLSTETKSTASPTKFKKGDGGPAKPPLFPAPYPIQDSVLALRPIYGSHRPSHNAIFSFARGYELPDYLPFITSLFAQGYDGDLVLGVKPDMRPELRLYFKHLVKEHPGVVIYDIELSCTRVRIRTHCQTVGMFGLRRAETNGDKIEILADTRPRREAAQLRFEYFWAWTTMYDPSSNIWLLDARDVYFQRHPIDNELLRRASPSTTTLHVFEESSSQLLSKQPSNNLWIKTAYSKPIFKRLASHTVICSGSTFGGQPAVEWYTRAMVHQWDVTNCTKYGCDQGHHNYLIGENQLVADGGGIAKVEVYKQGEGAVNTLGLLVSNVGNLTTLGLLNDKLEVTNNDRTTVSPIIHQFDRDDRFRDIMIERKQQLLDEWNTKQTKS